MTFWAHCHFPCISSKLVAGFLLAAALLLSLILPQHAHGQNGPNLNWLQEDISCTQLAQEVKSRYAAVGSFAQLSDVKREELALVLDIICSARFAKCGFKNCAKLAPAKVASPADEPAAQNLRFDVQSEAQRLLDEKVESYRAALRQHIEAAVASEAASKKVWMRVSILSAEEPLSEPDPFGDFVRKPKSEKKAGSRASVTTKEPQRATSQRSTLPGPKTARPRPKAEFRAQAPATPEIDISGSFSPNRGKFLPRSAAAFHRFTSQAIIPFSSKEKTRTPSI